MGIGTMGRVTAFLALAGLVAASAWAIQPVGGDVRVTVVGTEGDNTRDASNEAIAYNPRRNEYLVVYRADPLPTPNEVEVFGRLVSPAGSPLGQSFRISNVSTDGIPQATPFDADVAYNASNNQYLVVWSADGSGIDEEREIFAQRLDPTGGQLGGDFRISTTGGALDPDRDALDPTVAYNSRTGGYLVAWEADPFTNDNEWEIFAQRLSATGGEQGGDTRVTNVGADGDAGRDGTEPAIAYNSSQNQYLVAFLANPLAEESEHEIYGQRLSASAGRLGGGFRVSSVGVDGGTQDAEDASVAYNPRDSQYLVAWEAPTDSQNKYEIFAQRISSSGVELGPDTRISFTGALGDPDQTAIGPAAIGFSPTGKEYLLAWVADGTDASGEPDTKEEIFAQRLSRFGRPLDGNVRISHTPPADDAGHGASVPDLAPRIGSTEYLISFTADPFANFNEDEVFVHRLQSPRCGGRRATVVGSALRDVLKGTRRRDVIAGLDGKDKLVGLRGKDILCGGLGRDRLVGGGDADRLLGGRGGDRLVGGPGRDKLKGGPGRDRQRQ